MKPPFHSGEFVLEGPSPVAPMRRRAITMRMPRRMTDPVPCWTIVESVEATTPVAEMGAVPTNSPATMTRRPSSMMALASQWTTRSSAAVRTRCPTPSIWPVSSSSSGMWRRAPPTGLVSSRFRWISSPRAATGIGPRTSSSSSRTPPVIASGSEATTTRNCHPIGLDVSRFQASGLSRGTPTWRAAIRRPSTSQVQV